MTYRAADSKLELLRLVVIIDEGTGGAMLSAIDVTL